MRGEKRIIIDDADRIGQWVAGQADVLWLSHSGTAIGLEQGGELIAGVVYQNYNSANVFTHIAAKGTNWLTRAFLWIIFDYPFTQLGCKRITATVLASNARCIKFIEHLGFTLEATLTGAAVDGDVLIYRMFKQDCKWVGLPIKPEELSHGQYI